MNGQGDEQREGPKGVSVEFAQLRQMPFADEPVPTDRVRQKAGTAPRSSSRPGLYPMAVLVVGPVPPGLAVPAVPVGRSEQTFRERALASWLKLSSKQKLLAAGAPFMVGLLLLLTGARREPRKSGSPGGASQEFHSGSAVQPSRPTSAAPTMIPGLVGTWTQTISTSIRTVDDVLLVVSHRHITINTDGTFADRSERGSSSREHTGLADGSRNGRVIASGNMLHFAYDNGQRWSARFQLLGSDGLRLDGGGELYIRR